MYYCLMIIYYFNKIASKPYYTAHIKHKKKQQLLQRFKIFDFYSRIFAMISDLEELDAFFLSYMPQAGTAPGLIRNARLERMESLLYLLGNPEKKLKCYHIAGSKGKGSTATMLSVLLEKAGFKTGLYTSPHVYDLRERFTLSGRFFDTSVYLEVANSLEQAITGIRDFRPTTFELYTAYAYLLFVHEGCTHAVIETGMGGRLDATNTLEPEAAILMPIELEHTNVLGSTITEIATEKSKIIKKGCRVYISRMKKEAEEVFIEEARRLNCQALTFSEGITDLLVEEKQEVNRLSFCMDGKHYCLHPKLYSRAILENLAFALLIAGREGFLTSKGIKALEQLRIPGRFEIRKIGKKTVILEVAHTLESVKNALAAYKSYHPANDGCVLFSSIDGKDYRGMLSELVSSFDRIVITKAGSFKKSNADQLYEYARSLAGQDKKILLEKQENKALSLAFELSDIILIIGSFYLVGEFGEIDA